MPENDALITKTQGVVTEDLSHWDAKANELIEWLKDRWSTPSNVFIKTNERSTVVETLLDLWPASQFLFFEQPEKE